MTKIVLYDWILECEVEETSKAYSIITQGSAEICDCLYCKNFSALTDDFFQGDFGKLLQNLGVDCKKDTEIYQFPFDQGNYSYAGWFHCIGNIKQKGEVINLENELKVYFIESNDLMFDVFKGKELIQIEFLDAILPWMMNELPPA